ncbi:MAG: MarR family transcriptional regulator [Methanosarcinales archaeon]|nr:MarR family transcriptional regulator [Methanosarcinales archaeon]
MRRSFPFIALFLITTLSAVTASGAVVSGDTIRWDTLEPLPDTIIRIYQNNDLIQQVKCDDNGAYSVNLTPDRYHLTALTIENGTVAYVSELNITISESGARIDIPMFPPFEELFPDVEEFVAIYDQIELISAINESEYDNDTANASSYTLNDGDETQSETGITEIIKKYNYIFIPLLLFIIVIVLTSYFLKAASSMDKEMNDISGTTAMETDDPGAGTDDEDTAQKEVTPYPDISVQDEEGLSDDEHTILRVLEDAGGSIQQKQLVKEMECSPAKVSLLLKGLEEKGFVKKQTIGRTNLVKLL